MPRTVFKIGNKDYTGMILQNLEIERPKLWGSDTGRVMSGKWVGTLIGIFPKINPEFFPSNEDELAELCTQLDKASLNIAYYSPKHKGLVSLGTYQGDYKVTYNKILDGQVFYASVKCSFIALEKE